MPRRQMWSAFERVESNHRRRSQRLANKTHGSTARTCGYMVASNKRLVLNNSASPVKIFSELSRRKFVIAAEHSCDRHRCTRVQSRYTC